MRRITVVGTGFAALTAVIRLRAADPSLEISVIAPKAEFVYYPSLIWIPNGMRQPQDLIVPLEGFFRRKGVAFHDGEVTGLKQGGRTVAYTGGELENDGLIIASGGRFIKKLPGIEHSITPCEGVDAAIAIRDRLKTMPGGAIAFGFSGNPKEPSAMRGGPMFEFLFGIDKQLRREKRRDNFKLVFFTPAAKPGARLGPKAVGALLKEMQRRGIETHLGHKLKGFTENSVITEGGEFAADMILFMPGMTGNQWFDNTDLPRSDGGLLRADRYCRVEGMDRVYVAGDSGSFPGPEWLPKQAHMADLQARSAVTNLLGELKGEAPSSTFRAELICIVDSQDSGMLVARNEKYNVVMPSMRLFHWTKRYFENWYLRQLR